MYDLASLSLQPPASFPELYQELWWYSGSSISFANNSNSANGSYLVTKGLTSGFNSYTVSQTKLGTFSANWPATTKCAFEVTIWGSGSGTWYAELWDITSNSGVSGSQVSTTSGTATVLRSGQFTLTPGHSYGITLWSTSTSNTTYITDASLIIFPPAGSVSPSLSSISLANPSGGSLKEAYIPLWVYSSGSATSTSSGNAFLQKGSTSTTATVGAPVKLHTLSSAWSPSQKFAFEASIYNNGGVGAANALLYDFTASANVSGTTVSTTSTTATVIRSGQFMLTPGHVYGVILNIASNTAYLTKAHLVAIGG